MFSSGFEQSNIAMDTILGYKDDLIFKAKLYGNTSQSFKNSFKTENPFNVFKPKKQQIPAYKTREMPQTPPPTQAKSTAQMIYDVASNKYVQAGLVGTASLLLGN